MGPDSIVECELWTSRLFVADWHQLARRFGLDLAGTVGHILTPATTAELPIVWQGVYDGERARAWIDDRDRESPTLLVVERRTAEAVGLLILFESRSTSHDERADVRVGYVIAEPAWGHGFATEIIRALVEWGQSQPAIGSLSAGVTEGNHASERVLIKNGFRLVDAQHPERIFRRAFDT